ncbi:MAG TPA: hypothetical protein PLP25_06085 [Candidatus Limiplasma sp.]|nr:hypothetical protein [Candidatus Limiplasma sp.]HPS81410.1 hypothetical protein [Candidatus Limiplasma sp.]
MTGYQSLMACLCAAGIALGGLAMPTEARAQSTEADVIAEYRQLYGYSPVAGDLKWKDYLDYGGYSGCAALDCGQSGQEIDTLYGDVQPQDLENYLVYAQRFGYEIEIDTPYLDGRSLTLTCARMPFGMPDHFSVEYDSADQTLVTMLPISALTITTALVASRSKAFTPELGLQKPLSDTLTVCLNEARRAEACAVTPAASPYGALALPGQCERMLTLPLTALKQPGQPDALVFHGLKRSDNSTRPLWLLRVTVANSGEPVAVSDLEFCLGVDEATVTYPIQMGVELLENASTPVLNTALPETVGRELSLWLLFPSVPWEPTSQVRLYGSLAKDGTALLSRLSIGCPMESDPS